MHQWLYSFLVLLMTGGIPILLIWDTERISEAEFHDIRYRQIEGSSIAAKDGVKEVLYKNHLVISDYFRERDSLWIFTGGIEGSSWTVGQSYAQNEILSFNSTRNPTSFYGFKWGNDDYYINVDRGNDEAIRSFLETMDHMVESNLDTLVLDLRFLRSIDFGAVLRLFNQIAPAQKMVFGTIIDRYHSEEIISSGRPFFNPRQTVFLVNEYIPDPVKLLVSNLEKIPTYESLGNLGTVRDTVCLETLYESNNRAYQVCTQYFTDGSSRTDRATQNAETDSLLLDNFAKMDELWYKTRDSAATQKLITSSLSRL